MVVFHEEKLREKQEEDCFRTHLYVPMKKNA